MINREQLIKILSKPLKGTYGIAIIESFADYLLNNDVFPIVWYEDCVNWKADGFRECEIMNSYMSPDDFCKYGERRTDGTEID